MHIVRALSRRRFVLGVIACSSLAWNTAVVALGQVRNATVLLDDDGNILTDDSGTALAID
jgi:hypothetical protein